MTLFKAYEEIVLLMITVALLGTFSYAAMNDSYDTLEEMTDKNLYLIKNKLKVIDELNGDLTFLGMRLYIEEFIKGDVTVAADEIRVKSHIKGDLRCAARKLYLDSIIEGDLVAAVNELEMTPRARVEGDILLVGNDIDINGRIKGNTRLAANHIIFNGTAYGNSSINANTFQLGRGSKFVGNLKYGSAEEIGNLVNFVEGDLSYEDTDKGSFERAFAVSLKKLYSFISLSLLGLIIINLFPNAARKVTSRIRDHPRSSILFGLLVIVGVPIVTLILFLTVIGIPIALILLPGIFITIFISRIFAAYFLGRLVIKAEHFRKYHHRLGRNVVLLIGAALYVGLSSIPIIGSIVTTFLIIVTIGALTTTQRKYYFELRKMKIL